ncbi:RCC1/BLIP-II [Cristinia sonorae]|uniref:RCC1/BLIP-II n=1 Tax=Cristinia sonorae TaxID=1940300 RepID=A0A8K0V0M2_9AGAR|nr:RCC1/BLIP-II [Cristinia sonorae]
MLRGAQLARRARCTHGSSKRLLSSTRNISRANGTFTGRPTAVGTAVAVTAVAASLMYASQQEVVYADAPNGSGKLSESDSNVQRGTGDDGTLWTLVWGSNRNHVLTPDSAQNESIRGPTNVEWLQSVALRDLVLHNEHAACIDSKGDVYQWGDGFFGDVKSSTKPLLTLREKNIVALQATPSRIFALSASGRIYVLAASLPKQELPVGTPTPSSTPWWGTGWIWGEEEEHDFAEITPSEKLSWNEKFVSISAGNDHLLALTSSGRTFAHPINLNANSHGQVGTRKFDIPDHNNSITQPHARIPLELTPKAIADPYATTTPAIRRVSEVVQQENGRVDDGGIHFSDRLFEIPALKGVQVRQVATGSRSSFVRTSEGRVLGWGANEYGQIGLGGNVTLNLITVPTEVILWRNTPQTMRTMCLNVYAGGDLTFFTVERSDGTGMPYVDVLACGNGQWGGLGNALFSNAQGTPLRAKNVSGLLEYSEKHNNLQPIYPHDISISPTGHVLLTLDTLTRSGPGGGGRDLLVWGANQEYQLGNGKRGSLATPTALESADGQRFMLGKKRAVEVRDLRGRVWKKGVEVEQRAVTGYGNSVVYWKICS